MNSPSRILGAAALACLAVLAGAGTAGAQDGGLRACDQNAMIVFDASGSMAGSTTEDIFSPTTRLGEVRKALQQVLPGITQDRKVGLITYGPGPYGQCNVNFHFGPIPNAAQAILSVVSKLSADGKTPLTAAVKRAAEALNYRTTPGVVVLLTDGEETCGGDPCALGKMLAATGHVTVHVIAYQMKGVEWTGEQSILDTECLAHATGGEFVKAQNRADLVKAFQKMLGCPLLSDAGTVGVLR
jgi:Ca-activated chloride channel homolog